MRELERLSEAPSSRPPRIAVVGVGRLGTAIGAGLRAAGVSVDGPLRRGERVADPDEGTVVLLCVPDEAIAAVAATIPPGPVLGHCSGASDLDVLGDRSGFSLHPLMTVPEGSGPEVLRGAGAAIDATDRRALAFARGLADALALRAVAVASADRPAYHAAASIASNFLVTLEAAAEQLGASAGLQRAELVPLVRATVENWAALGPRRALTGPVARGDITTVGAQRDAIAQRAPELLELFDALVDATRRLAGAEAIAC